MKTNLRLTNTTITLICDHCNAQLDVVAGAEAQARRIICPYCNVVMKQVQEIA